MKNKHIKQGEVVPPELRIEVYKELIQVIENGENLSQLYDGIGLCLGLMCALWRPESYLDNVPGILREWEPISYSESHNMFPEFKKEIIYTIADNAHRVELLKQFIKEVEQKLTLA